MLSCVQLTRTTRGLPRGLNKSFAFQVHTLQNPPRFGVFHNDDSSRLNFEERIIHECETRELRFKELGQSWVPAAHIVDPHDGQSYYVKYGKSAEMMAQNLTQNYIAHMAASASSDPKVPRVPRVLQHFTHPNRRSRMYLVIEFTKTRLPPDTPEGVEALDKQIKDSVIWLANVPPPPDHPPRHIGPVGGGLIRHTFFPKRSAPIDFSGIDALQRYLDALYQRLPLEVKERHPPINIQNDRIMFTQSDMYFHKFGVDETGKVVLMDFENVQLFPETLAAFTMTQYGYLDLIEALGLPTESNYLLTRMARHLRMTVDSHTTLGLNKDGLIVSDILRFLANEGVRRSTEGP